mmetsp:Transcript_14519/g.35466  ORF Transcript_14519/g.35466 Transcript_14519/m.35466 type:complete len:215 (+) Transcript_14519:421-1065(+)
MSCVNCLYVQHALPKSTMRLSTVSMSAWDRRGPGPARAAGAGAAAAVHFLPSLLLALVFTTPAPPTPLPLLPPAVCILPPFSLHCTPPLPLPPLIGWELLNWHPSSNEMPPLLLPPPLLPLPSTSFPASTLAHANSPPSPLPWSPSAPPPSVPLHSFELDMGEDKPPTMEEAAFAALLLRVSCSMYVSPAATLRRVLTSRPPTTRVTMPAARTT